MNKHSARRNQSRTNSGGFTIIEVMIVLAIGGMMMLLVLTAIPALQRSSRNNQRKQDVSNILAAVSHYELNHSANFPPTPPTAADGKWLTYSGIGKNLHLTYYDKDNVSATTYLKGTDSKPSTVDASTDLDSVTVYNYYKCNVTVPGQATSVGAGYRDVVAIYASESGSGTNPQCVDL